VLDGQHGADLRERRLRRAVPAPGLVGLERGVGDDVDDPCPFGEPRQGKLDESERRKHVGLVDAPQLVERVARQRRQRAQTENARVVDDQVDRLACAFDQSSSVLGVGDIARNEHVLRSVRPRLGECDAVARVDDDPPAAVDERPSECEPEPARRSGDDSAHASTVGARRVPAASGNWS
jgi:hypothetical protein